MEKRQYKVIHDIQDDNWWYASRRKMFSGLFGNLHVDSVLDIGSGMGSNFPVLRSVATRVIAVDLEQASLQACREKGYDETVAGSAEKIPLPDASVHAILAADILEHVDDDLALEEIRRIMHPDGVLIVSVPAFRWLWNWNDDTGQHLRRYTMNELTSKLKLHGFRIEHATYWNALFVLPAFLVAMLQKCFKKPEQFQNNLSYIPSWLNQLITFYFKFENRLALAYGLPFGVSIMIRAIRTSETRHQTNR